MRWCSSSGVSSRGEAPPMPALLTSTPTGPRSATIAKARLTDSVDVTSSGTVEIGKLASAAAAWRGSAFARFRIPAKTWKPWRARRRLVAKPMPVLVPVTTAISMFGLLSRQRRQLCAHRGPLQPSQHRGPSELGDRAPLPRVHRVESHRALNRLPRLEDDDRRPAQTDAQLLLHELPVTQEPRRHVEPHANGPRHHRHRRAHDDQVEVEAREHVEVRRRPGAAVDIARAVDGDGREERRDRTGGPDRIGQRRRRGAVSPEHDAFPGAEPHGADPERPRRPRRSVDAAKTDPDPVGRNAAGGERRGEENAGPRRPGTPGSAQPGRRRRHERPAEAGRCRQRLGRPYLLEEASTRDGDRCPGDARVVIPRAHAGPEERANDRARRRADDDLRLPRLPSRDLGERSERARVERVPEDTARTEHQADSRHSASVYTPGRRQVRPSARHEATGDDRHPAEPASPLSRERRSIASTPSRTRAMSAPLSSPPARVIGCPMLTRTQIPHGTGSMLWARRRHDSSIAIGTTGVLGAASSRAARPARRNSPSAPRRARVPSGKMTAEQRPSRTRSPSSRIAATADGASRRSISTWPPRRRLYDTLGIQRASSRLETYFGKFDRNSAPMIGMSNMLW